MEQVVEEIIFYLKSATKSKESTDVIIFVRDLLKRYVDQH